MKTFTLWLSIVALSLLTACSGAPVKLGSPIADTVPIGTSRTIQARACGFQLLLFIPIMVNGRLEHAYADLQEQANGDYITDVHAKESWTYAFVGTAYCTELEATAIHVAAQ